MLKVYLSGALTGIDNLLETKEFYESIGRVCHQSGFQAYIPHINTDPIDNPNITPRQVFETDKSEVTQADILIAYLGIPSFGVGMELAYAEVNAIPIILIYEQHKTISRFPRGIPTIISDIQFSDYDDALSQLRQVLRNISFNGKYFP